MLRQEDPQPTPSTLSAAQTRVTPEELAHALAALEARRLDETRYEENTIPIGQAVSELDIDATSEEVLAEVLAQRRAKAETAPPAPPAQQAPPTEKPKPPLALPPLPPLHQTVTDALRQAATAAAPGLKQAALAASPALKQGLDAISLHAKQPKAAKPKWRKESWAAFGIFFAFVGIAQSGLFNHHSHARPAPHARLLSTVPDGHEVSADTATVQTIGQGAAPATVTVWDGGPLANGWTLVRHDKHWYVRGYTLNNPDAGLPAVKVYNDNDAGELEGKPENDVTLRLDNTPITDTNAGDHWSEIDMGPLHPDRYTHEDW